jgi:hypothetical protein
MHQEDGREQWPVTALSTPYATPNKQNQWVRYTNKTTEWIPSACASNSVVTLKASFLPLFSPLPSLLPTLELSGWGLAPMEPTMWSEGWDFLWRGERGWRFSWLSMPKDLFNYSYVIKLYVIKVWEPM